MVERIAPYLSLSYALCRSLIALSLLLTLAFNPPWVLFHPTALNLSPPDCSGPWHYFNLFCLLENRYVLSYGICILILLGVLSGWRPRFTGVLHAWVAFSMFHAVTLVEGGEQIALNATLLLIPLTLLDRRKNHWDTAGFSLPEASFQGWIYQVFYFLFRLQVAFVYLQAGVGKASVEDWQNGTAPYYYATSPMFGMSAWLEPLLLPIFSNPLALTFITYGTIVLELCLFAGLFMEKKYKGTLFGLAVFFHLGIALVHGLITFSLIMIGCLVLFLREPEIRLTPSRSPSEIRPTTP